MKKILLIITAVLGIYACGSKQGGDKKAELAKLQAEAQESDDEMPCMEQDGAGDVGWREVVLWRVVAEVVKTVDGNVAREVVVVVQPTSSEPSRQSRFPLQYFDFAMHWEFRHENPELPHVQVPQLSQYCIWELQHW